jgi:hypothetical protein
VILTTGLALVELRMQMSAAAHVLILAAAAAVILGLGVQAPSEGGRPPAYQSVLVVCGLLLLYAALLRLADVLGANPTDSGGGDRVWTGLIEAGVAGWVAAYRHSAISALIAALAAGVAVLSGFDWLLDPSGFGAARWLLLLLAGGLVLASLVLRAGLPRHAELLVDGAAVAILVIGLQALIGVIVSALLPFGTSPAEALPGFWEFVLLAAGCGLVAYGAVDRAPGPAWLGVANLAVFVLIVGQDGHTLKWWPLLLLVLGLGTLLAGLRPRAPLPHEPEPGAYRAGEQPLAARTADDDTIVVRVRDDRPASR